MENSYIAKYMCFYCLDGDDEDDQKTWRGLAQYHDILFEKNLEDAWGKFRERHEDEDWSFYLRDTRYDFPGVCAVWKSSTIYTREYVIIVHDTTAEPEFFDFITDKIFDAEYGKT